MYVRRAGGARNARIGTRVCDREIGNFCEQQRSMHPTCVGRLGTFANSSAACTPRELRGPLVGCLVPRSSSSGFLKRFWDFGKKGG
eukprot:5324272-Alexandrium_andersonii.AAC.1